MELMEYYDIDVGYNCADHLSCSDVATTLKVEKNKALFICQLILQGFERSGYLTGFVTVKGLDRAVSIKNVESFEKIRWPQAKILKKSRDFNSINGFDYNGNQVCLYQYTTIKKTNGNWVVIVKQSSNFGFYISYHIERIATEIYLREFEHLNVDPMEIEFFEWYPTSEFAHENNYPKGFAKVILDIKYKEQTFLDSLLKRAIQFDKYSDVLGKLALNKETLKIFHDNGVG